MPANKEDEEVLSAGVRELTELPLLHSVVPTVWRLKLARLHL